MAHPVPAFEPHPGSQGDEVLAEAARRVRALLAGRSYQLLLFGSRTQGRSTNRSDYDLAILADEPLPLTLMAQLRAALEDLPVLQKVDLVDVRSVSPEFAKEVMASGVLLDVVTLNAVQAEGPDAR